MKKLLSACVTVAIGGSIGLAGAPPVAAGETVAAGSVYIRIQVEGSESVGAAGLLATLDPELFSSGGGDIFDGMCAAEPAAVGDDDYAAESHVCDPVALDTYDFGLDPMALPAGMYADAFCAPFDEVAPNERFTDPLVQAAVSAEVPDWWCEALVAPARDVYVDKVVMDESEGAAVSGDFTLELYDDGGGLVGTAVDADPDQCAAFAVPDSCAVFEAVPPGTYHLGEAAVQGYGAVTVSCGPFFWEVFLNDALPNGTGEFTHPLDSDSLCTLTNAPGEASITVSKSVDNTAGGGAATAADFTLELYDDAMQLVASGVCPADGMNCIATTLPNGEYHVGETGPSGYTAAVVCDVTPGPDPTVVTTTQPILTEIIADAGAEFEVDLGGSAACTVTNVGPSTTTSTSTTTTTMATTTTEFDAGGATLPATGTSSSTNQSVTMAAVLLVLIGGSLLLVRRRSA